MALDGIVLSNIMWELKQTLLDGKVDKIYQPEAEEIILLLRQRREQYKLLLTAHPNHPRIHLTTQNKENPLAAPMFCMLLRKHLMGYKIVDIQQPSFERIIILVFEGLNELGDLCSKELIIEMMGRHSNIILIDQNKKIIDSIKHVTREVSSIRQVLPGYLYQSPPSQNKKNPLECTKDNFFSSIEIKQDFPIQKAIYQTYSGISPMVASEVCFRSQVDGSTHVSQLNDLQKQSLSQNFMNIIIQIKENKYEPNLVQDEKRKLIEFSSIVLKQLTPYEITIKSSICEVVETFYIKKDLQTRLQQKTADLKKNVHTNLERCFKKKDLQLQQLKDIKDREKWKIQGELLTAHIYQIVPGSSSVTVTDYYDINQTKVTIPLDPTLSPAQNAQKYFSKYNKAKRTFVAVSEQIQQVNEEIEYLETVLNAIQSATHEEDILQIREELQEQGYIRKKKIQRGKQRKLKGKPLRFMSTDGLEIWVGKNNYQNDELTMKIAHSNDLWFHTKNIPGSHVILKTHQKEISEIAILQAAHLAAYYSKARNSSNVPVDYTLCKFVKKPNGAKPGFVIYEKNKTMYVTPDESMIEKLLIPKQ